MKVFKSNRKNIKWYKRINWVKTVLLLVIISVILFFIFNFLGKGKDIEKAVMTSVSISLLITIETIIIDTVENRKTILWIDKKELLYIELHDKKDGKFLSDSEFDKIIENKELKDIYTNIKDYEGIDCGKIVSVDKIVKKNNKMVVKANVDEQEWIPVGRITIKKLSLINSKYNKKIIIPNDYDNYEELYKVLNDKKISK